MFKTPENPAGFFVAIGYIMNEDGSEGMLGGNANLGGRFFISTQDGSFDGKVFHHEIFHATEALVSRYYPLDNEGWNALNPEGFEYGYDNFDENNAAYNVTGEDPYFIDSACITQGAVEDRAIMMGRLVNTGDTTEFECEFKDRYDYIRKYPHIVAKMDFLADWTKQYFGYVYWTSLLNLPEDEYDSKVAGDINEDEKLDIEDAVMMVNHINGVSALNKFQENKGDVDGSNTIDIEDVAMMINDINGVSPLKK